MKVLSARPLADSAVTLVLAEAAGPEAASRVGTALAAIRDAILNGAVPGASEVAASFVSLTVHYDPLISSQADLMDRITAILDPLQPGKTAAGRQWRLPCCYDASCGIDLSDLSDHLGLEVQDIVARHAAIRFDVYAIGFLPGLPFMGELPPELARPRRHEPRTHVPAGSVAIANRMGVIYPWVSPGGWHVVGACAVPLFDAARPVPALLAAGDCVQFDPGSLADHDALRRDLAAGRLDPMTFCDGGE
ncbi:MAG: allophanate hydrolase subunit 1 [Gemmobacter sp.]|nr:allophanate hydrolase subunit 1 [Gemmobacter sp.]